ncbi:delta-aminolevulinic acid dehydratase, chloroplastic-like [Hordeum vulgare]|nr:delta-aminolevulinic acid dehydratase, chloroplastic-like [Hordeum vulgare]
MSILAYPFPSPLTGKEAMELGEPPEGPSRRGNEAEGAGGGRSGVAREASGQFGRSRPVAARASAERDGAAAAVQAWSGRTIEECEADAVAGKFPAAPPPTRSQAPSGTPEIRPLDMAKRPRQNRRSPALRAAFQETSIAPANLVLLLFIHEGEEDTPIGAMPGCFRLGWRHGLLEEVTKNMVNNKQRMTTTLSFVFGKGVIFTTDSWASNGQWNVLFKFSGKVLHT